MDDIILDQCDPITPPPRSPTGSAAGGPSSTSSSAYYRYSETVRLVPCLYSRFHVPIGQPGRAVFEDLLWRLHDQFITATSLPPLHRLTSFVVPSDCFFRDFLRDVNELVASVMVSQDLLAPTNCIRFNILRAPLLISITSALLVRGLVPRELGP